MALQGSIDEQYLSSIFQMLRTDRKTGLFRAYNGRDEIKIYFSEGDVIYATGSNKNFLLGQLLLQEKLISAEQLNTYLEEAETKKEPFGKFLVENDLLSADNLIRILHKQTEALILQLFFWDKGHFEYRDVQINIKGKVPAKINIMKIILEATRKIDELGVLKKHLPDDDVILQVSKWIDKKKEFKLSTDELQVLTLVDGRTPLGQLVKSNVDGPLAVFDHFSIYKHILSLISAGLVEPISSPGLRIAQIDRTILITFYNDILQVLQRRLETEIGRQTEQLFADCKKHLSAQAVNLLENYNPSAPAATNIQFIFEALKAVEESDGGAVLLNDQFNSYISHILRAIPDLLGTQIYSALVAEIDNILEQVTPRNDPTNDMDPIIESLKEVINRTTRRLTER